MKKIKTYHSAPLFCLAVYILITLSLLFNVPYDGSIYSVLAVSVLQIAIFILPGVLYCRLEGTVSPKELGFRGFRIQNVALIIFAALFLFSLSVLFGLADPDYVQTGAVTDVTSLSPQAVIYITVIYCILPAVTEEFVFRSIIYNKYKKYGVFSAAAFSSVLFALAHFSLSELPKFLICGVVLALVYEVSHSVFVSIAVHFLFNLLTVFSQKLLTDAAGKSENTVPFIFLFVSIALITLFLSLSRAQSQLEYDSVSIRPADNEKEQTFQFRMRALLLSFLSPAFLCCVIFAVAAAIIRLKHNV